ncbi:MAG: ABC transporter substrate-binding protein [Lautropia sp.]
MDRSTESVPPIPEPLAPDPSFRPPRRLALSGALGTGLGLALPPARAQTADIAALAAAAQKEGTIAFYSASVGVPDYVAVIRNFEKRYGIQVNVLEARASEINERIRTELATGRPSADIIYTGEATMATMKRAGMLDPLPPLPLAGKLEAPFAVDSHYAPVQVNSYGLLINTALVSAADAPKSWRDVLDPKWRGRILADDPRALGGGNVAASVLYETFGRSYHEQLAAQKPQFAREQRQSQRRIARGEFPLYLPFTMTDILRLTGLPVRAISPVEGNPYVVFSLGIVKGARRSNAAQLLINHFFDAESSREYFKNGKAVTVPASKDGLSPELRALVDVKLLGKQDAAKTPEYLALFKEIYGS